MVVKKIMKKYRNDDSKKKFVLIMLFLDLQEMKSKELGEIFKTRNGKELLGMISSFLLPIMDVENYRDHSNFNKNKPNKL